MKHFIGIKKMSAKDRATCNKYLRENFREPNSYKEYQLLTRGRKPRIKSFSDLALLEYFYHREWYTLIMDFNSRVFPTKVLNPQDLEMILEYLLSVDSDNVEYPEQLEMLIKFLTILIKKEYSLVPIT